MQLIKAALVMDTGPKRDPFLEYSDIELSDSEYSNPGYIEYTPPRPSTSSYCEDFPEWYDSEMTECNKGSDSSSYDESVSSAEVQSDSSDVSVEEHMQELSLLMDSSSQKEISFSQDHGVSPTLQILLKNDTPLSFFKFFIDENIISDMVLQTNLYASRKLRDQKKLSPHSRLRLWEPTCRSEMMKFLGILGYMGLVRLQSVQCYWSTSKLFNHKIIRRTMSKSRFRNLLAMWNFQEQDQPSEDTSPGIQSLVDNFARNCRMGYRPGENCYLHHNVQQCSKRSKEEVQTFKVLSSDCFTWNLKISTDKNLDSTEVATDLCQSVLHSGRTIFTDNYFTSLDLSTRLISAKTHLVGTFNSTQNNIPNHVIAQLKEDEIVIQNNDHNVTLMKYPNKKNVLVLSTKDSYKSSEMETDEHKIRQPKVISDYKKAKRSLNILEKNSTANTCLDRSMNWQKKVAFDLIWNTAILNAHCLYQTICKTISITKFRQEIIKGLLQPYNNQKEEKQKKDNLKTHTFVKKKGVSRIGRKYCRGCYRRKLKGEISKNTVRKVISFCLECDGQPRYCLPCFKERHNQV